MIAFLAGLFLIVGFFIKAEEINMEVLKKATPNATTLLLKPEIPVLCYHRIRNIHPSDSQNMKTYSVTPERFAQHMKALSEHGYHTILPDQLYEYLTHDEALPSKPVLITFDDGREEQYRLGATEMNKYGFKAVFFIMTVSINKKGYMTNTQIKALSDNGHCIGAHSWDHHAVTKYEEKDWDIQLIRPKKQLEQITGKSVNYFAYPFGVWNKESIPKIKKCGYQMAFALSTKRDINEPLYTIRRLIVPSSMSSDRMLKEIQSSFK